MSYHSCPRVRFVIIGERKKTTIVKVMKRK